MLETIHELGAAMGDGKERQMAHFFPMRIGSIRHGRHCEITSVSSLFMRTETIRWMKNPVVKPTVSFKIAVSNKEANENATAVAIAAARTGMATALK